MNATSIIALTEQRNKAGAVAAKRRTDFGDAHLDQKPISHANSMLGPQIRGITKAERQLQENSRVGASEFERSPSWAWRMIAFLALIIWAAIRFWT